ncbi:MAG: biotin carboxylase N-terminal domain-containing protein [Myxococcota bacterium]
MTIDTVFIANRGEIAVRIARSARARGTRAVGVYSDADAHSLHVSLLDESIRLPGHSASETYLDAEKLLASADRLGADAVHPGYGFLSESADFAEACVDAGLNFIGPPPEAIRIMGDKAAGKRAMEAAGVPTIPGYRGAEQSDAILIEEARRLGTPLLIKAAAGGGGRGMRRVDDMRMIKESILSARREAEAAFGRGDLILERLLRGPRHIEVQIVADASGATKSLFERDCSVQRRHQKIIEEAPCAALDSALRQKISEVAIRAAEAVGYRGAGTVEFLLAEDGEFFFIEMNTRLQVEHPVTEMVADFDLVELQFLIAEGHALPEFLAEPRGHAIEARVYAEDPWRDYAPQTGRIKALQWPDREGIRVDAGVRAGQLIGSYYDPMLSKVVAYGADRDQARRRLLRALEETSVLGVGCNIEQLCEILRHPTFVAGDARTDWLDQERLGPPVPTLARRLAVLVYLKGREGPEGELGSTLGRSARLLVDDDSIDACLRGGPEASVLEIGDQAYHAGRCSSGEVELDERRLRFTSAWVGEELHLSYRGSTVKVSPARSSQRRELAAADGTMRSPMTGRVIRIAVEAQQRVAEGELLLLIEAMKMEHELRAPAAGRVEEVLVDEGTQVATHQTVMTLQFDEATV